MMDDIFAYVTVGMTTTRTEFERAVMRMRGLLSEKQKFKFIVTPHVNTPSKNCMLSRRSMRKS